MSFNKHKLNELTKKFPKLEAHILGVIRKEKFIILKKTDVIEENDKAYVIINSLQMQQTLQLLVIMKKFLIKY